LGRLLFGRATIKEEMMLEIRKIAVVGAGVMGRGIAQVAAQAGYEVAMSDIEGEVIQQALDYIKRGLGKLEEKEELSSKEVDKALARLTGTTDFAKAVSDADLVIEVVPEKMELKQSVFRKLDGACKEHTVMVTGTSSLSVTTIASATKRPDKVVGMGFSNPVPLMPGVQIVRGFYTSDETLAIARELARRMGKESIEAKDFPGFVLNRLLLLLVNEAFYVLWEGIATAEDIDKGAKIAWRHPMGIFELADLIGLDTLLSILENLHKEIGEKYRPCPLLKQYVAAGNLGRKSGRGVYVYTK